MGAPNPLLTQAELDAYGDVLRESLPDAAVITDVTRSLTPTATGGLAESYEDREPVDCRLSPLSSLTRQEQALAGKLTTEGEKVLTLPRGTILHTRDLVTVHKLADDGSVIEATPYSVAMVLGRTSYEVALRVIVMRLTD